MSAATSSPAPIAAISDEPAPVALAASSAVVAPKTASEPPAFVEPTAASSAMWSERARQPGSAGASRRERLQRRREERAERRRQRQERARQRREAASAHSAATTSNGVIEVPTNSESGSATLEPLGSAFDVPRPAKRGVTIRYAARRDAPTFPTLPLVALGTVALRGT